MQTIPSDTGGKSSSMCALRDTLASIVRTQQARITMLERALDFRPKDEGAPFVTTANAWQDRTCTRLVLTPQSLPVHNTTARMSFSECVQPLADNRDADAGDEVHAGYITLILSSTAAGGRTVTRSDRATRSKGASITRHDASTSTELFVRKDAATQLSLTESDEMQRDIDVELDRLRKDLATAQERGMQLEQMNVELRNELATLQQQSNDANLRANSVWNEVEAYQNRLERERAGKDSELRRLRILMRFSELKKDSDQLGAAHEELQRVTQAYTMLQAAHETLRAQSVMQATTVEAVMHYVRGQHRRLADKEATAVSDEARRLGLDMLCRIGRLCAEAGVSRVGDTMTCETHKGSNTYNSNGGVAEKGGTAAPNPSSLRRNTPSVVNALSRMTDTPRQHDNDTVTHITERPTTDSRGRRSTTMKGRSTLALFPTRGEGLARVRRSTSACGTVHNAAQGSALNFTRSTLFGKAANVVLSGNNTHDASLGHRRISSPRIVAAAGARYS